MRKRIFTLILAVLTALVPAAANASLLPGSLFVSASDEIRLTRCEVVIPSVPAAGESPDPGSYSVSPGKFETVRWIDMAEKREITSEDTFKEGHTCSFSAYVIAPEAKRTRPSPSCSTRIRTAASP